MSKKYNLFLLFVLLILPACQKTISPAGFEDIFQVPSTWFGALDADRSENVEYPRVYMNFIWREGNTVQGTFFIKDDILPNLHSGITDFCVEFQGRAAKFKFMKEEYSALNGLWLLYSNDKSCPRFYKGIDGSDDYYFVVLQPYTRVVQ